MENRRLPRNRVSKLLLALYGKPYISLRSAALDVVCCPDSAPPSVFNLFLYNICEKDLFKKN